MGSQSSGTTRSRFWVPVTMLVVGAACSERGDGAGLSSVEAAARETAWSLRAPMPTARNALGVAVVDGIVYAIGGWNEQGPVAAVEAYDPRTDTWSPRTPMPTARNTPATAVLNGKIYVIGGFAFRPLDVVEVYDPVTDTWTTRNPMPAPLAGVGGAALDGKVYVAGGTDGWQRLATVLAYDPFAETWTVEPSMNLPRENFALVAVDGGLLAVGGDWGRNQVERYDLATRTWTPRAPMPTPRVYVGAAVHGGEVYVAGAWEYAPSGEAEVYSPLTDTWQSLPPLAVGRNAVAMASAGKAVLAIGGWNVDGPSRSVEAYVAPRGALVLWDRGCSLLDGDGGYAYTEETHQVVTPNERGVTVLSCSAKVLPSSTGRAVHHDGSDGGTCWIVRDGTSVRAEAWQETVSASGEAKLTCRYACDAGETCTPTDSWGSPLICQSGVSACTSGLETCLPAGPSPDGALCYGPEWSSLVCNDGACTWCEEGVTECTLPEQPCRLATLTLCSTTGGTCTATGADRPDGAWCGDNQVCNEGACVACAWWQYCHPEGNSCQAGYTTCETGESVCTPYWSEPDGTSCDDGTGLCRSGECRPPSVPAAAPPRPTLPAGDVISLLSDAYVSVPVDTWRASWSSAQLEEVLIGEDHVKKYTSLDFVGVETTGPNLVDATAMTHVHLDVWTPVAQVFRLKLVDWGADGAWQGGDDTEHELAFDPWTTPALVPETWVSIDLPLDAFTGMTSRARLAQHIFSALPAGTVIVYVANLYFYRRPGPAVRSVTGTSAATYWPDDGVLVSQGIAGIDLVEAVSTSPSGPVVHPGTVFPDGSFNIDGVPEGPYLLRVRGFNGDTYLETDSSQLDLGKDVLGRPFVTNGDFSTAVTLDVKGFEPVPSPSVTFASSSIGAAATGGVTSTLSWANRPLLDSYAGDVAFVQQSVPLAGLPPSATGAGVTRCAQVPEGLVFGYGVTSVVDVTLDPCPLTGSFSSDWRVSRFLAYRARIHPDATLVNNRIALYARAHASPFAPGFRTGPLGGLTGLVLLNLTSTGSEDLALGPIPHARYLPTLWREYRHDRVRFLIPFTAPGATNPMLWGAALGEEAPASEAPGVVTPVLSPPGSLRIAGLDAWGPLPSVGASPVVSWEPPELVPAGGTVRYEVGVNEVRLASDGLGTQILRIFEVRTTSTSVTLPAGRLVPGNPYFVDVTAVVGEHDPEAPFRESIARAYATVVSREFRP